MKKKLIAHGLTLTALAVFIGLNTSSAQTTTTTVHHTTIKKTVVHHTLTQKPTAAELAQGKELLTKSDCLSCHKFDVKLVGPAYNDVAKKYPATEANYDLLANKVIKGGSGVWGQVPMVAHPNLSYDDAKKIIKYVLSLKAAK